MARTLIVKIVTPERELFSGEGTMVVLPALDGEIGILPLHVPLVSALTYGEVRVLFDGDRNPARLAISGGYVEVSRDVVTVLAALAVPAEEVVIADTEASIEGLTEALAEAEKGSADAERFDSDLTWARTQLTVAGRL